jgi:mannose-1-phosphate guanylyltransferase
VPQFEVWSKFKKRTRLANTAFNGIPSTRSERAPSGPENTAVLVIAGGRGTRFWPESRIHHPKPLFSIDGKTSLLATTVARMQPLIPRERVFVLASADQAPLFHRVLKKLIPPRNLIIEPEGRGTAVAIAFGAGVIAKRLSEDTVVAVMPADHYVTPASGFQQSLAEAIALAETYGTIVVIGIKPTRPESGYGYLKTGTPVEIPVTRADTPRPRSLQTTRPAMRSAGDERGKDERCVKATGPSRRPTLGFKLDRFVEKPSAAAAVKMIRSGKYLWNAGMFVMTAQRLATELARQAPSLAVAMHSLPAMKPAQLGHSYRTLNFDSFDRVVAEKARNLLGVRARFMWHDVGSWEGLWEALRGEGRDVLMGNIIDIGTDGVLARTRDRLMVLLGVKDIVAIETPDVILIANRQQSQNVRKVIDELKRRGLDDYL